MKLNTEKCQKCAMTFNDENAIEMLEKQLSMDMHIGYDVWKQEWCD